MCKKLQKVAKTRKNKGNIWSVFKEVIAKLCNMQKNMLQYV